MTLDFSGSLSTTLQQLYHRQVHGIKPGLEVEQHLLEGLGNPHLKIPVLHVAGTNGKGSVCAMLESILRASGLTTGLYTSPHLVDFRERIRVQGSLLARKDLQGLLEKVDHQADQVAQALNGREVTFFEFVTAMAFEYFRQKKVELSIIEVGMGGRLDATNVVDPLISVISGIDKDHTMYLGETVEAIAFEKAGIIKNGRPIVCGFMPIKCMDVIRRVAEKRNAPLFFAEEMVSVKRSGLDPETRRMKIETLDGSYGPFTNSLLGPHQLKNGALTIAVLEVLKQVYQIPVTAQAVKKGFESLKWPARCQKLEDAPMILLDAAHNVAGAKALHATLEDIGKNRDIALIIGFMQDKDYLGFIKTFSFCTKYCWAVDIPHKRGLPPEKVVEGCQAVGIAAEKNTLEQALDVGRAWAKERDGVLCIAGSLYLAGEVLRIIIHEKGQALEELFL